MRYARRASPARTAQKGRGRLLLKKEVTAPALANRLTFNGTIIETAPTPTAWPASGRGPKRLPRPADDVLYCLAS